MLFTRCPECDTTFRVTDETLKKANGQVRCGRCASVFNAYAELHDPTAKTFEPEAVKARSAAEDPPPPTPIRPDADHAVTPLPAPPPAGKAAEPDATAQSIGAASVAAVVAEAKLAAAEEEAAAEEGAATGAGSETRAGAGSQRDRNRARPDLQRGPAVTATFVHVARSR